jgi:hypothetical protein
MLRISNLVIERLYTERLREMLLLDAGLRDDAKEAAEALYSRPGSPDFLPDRAKKRRHSSQ